MRYIGVSNDVISESCSHVQTSDKHISVRDLFSKSADASAINKSPKDGDKRKKDSKGGEDIDPLAHMDRMAESIMESCITDDVDEVSNPYKRAAQVSVRHAGDALI